MGQGGELSSRGGETHHYNAKDLTSHSHLGTEMAYLNKLYLVSKPRNPPAPTVPIFLCPVYYFAVFNSYH